MKDMEKKYEMVKEGKLYRIVALRYFGNVKAGDKGGLIERELNLAHNGNCWVYEGAVVYDHASISGDAIVKDNAKVSGNAIVYDNAKILGDAIVQDYAQVSGNARVFDKAKVSGYAMVFGNAAVLDNAKVSGYAKVSGNVDVMGYAEVRGKARMYDNARVFGNAKVYDRAIMQDYVTVSGDSVIKGEVQVYGYASIRNAVVTNKKDYIVFKNWWSSGRYFTWTKCNNMWSVGCFYGTGEELIKKAYQDSEKSGREYERIVQYVESIINE